MQAELYLSRTVRYSTSLTVRDDDRKTLFNKIIDVVSLLGGDAGDAL